MLSLPAFADEFVKIAKVLRVTKRFPSRVGRSARVAVLGPKWMRAERSRLRTLLRERLPEGVAGRIRADLRTLK